MNPQSSNTGPTILGAAPPEDAYSGVFDFSLGGSRSLTLLRPLKQKTLDKLDFEFESRLNGLPSIRHVVNSTIQRVHELDLGAVVDGSRDFRRRDHWENYQGREEKVLAAPYPAHAMISVGENTTVDDVAAFIQRKFDDDRAKYPRSRGWNAMGVHYKSTIPLDKDHPFYRYLRTEKIGADCCRFLVVNRMAVEGIDNKFLNVYGIAENLGSEVEIVQRLGRLLRSAARRDGAQIFIPPASHDSVYLITHSTFGVRQGGKIRKSNVELITRAIYYLLHMEECTADLMTLEEYIALESGDLSATGQRALKSVTLSEKCNLVQAIGASLTSGLWPDLNALLIADSGDHTDDGSDHAATGDQDIDEGGSAGSGAKEALHAYAESLLKNIPVAYHVYIRGNEEIRVIDAVADVRTTMLRDAPPEADVILEAEQLFVPKFSISTAEAWLHRFPWAKLQLYSRGRLGDAEWLDLVEQMRHDWDSDYDTLEFDFDETPADRIRLMTDHISRRHKIRDRDSLVQQLVVEGVTYRLGLTRALRMADFEYGGSLCKSCVTYSLRNERFQDQLFKWVTQRLLAAGELPSLSNVLRNRQQQRPT